MISLTHLKKSEMLKMMSAGGGNGRKSELRFRKLHYDIQGKWCVMKSHDVVMHQLSICEAIIPLFHTIMSQGSQAQVIIQVESWFAMQLKKIGRECTPNMKSAADRVVVTIISFFFLPYLVVDSQ